MKFKILIAAVALISACAIPADVEAGGWRRVRTTCGYTYVQQPAQVVQKTETQTTVINNLVGIPVPVNYSQPIAAQGSTVYGYSAAAQQYSNVDMALLYNQAARLTDQAQQLAGQAATDFATLVQSEGQNRSEVAKILAQGQAARQALSATASAQRQPAAVKQRTFAFRVTQGSDGKMTVEEIKQKQNFELSSGSKTTTNISDFLKNSCVKCHGNTKASGNLNLESEITDAQQAKILARVTTDDLSKRMPRNPNGTAGQKLTVAQLRLLFDAMKP